MPEINQIQNLLASGGQAQQIPPDIRDQLLAAQFAQQTATHPQVPYSSRGVGALNAMTAGLGGLMEGMAVRRQMEGQRDGNTQAMNFLRQYQQSQGQGGAQGAAPATPAPAAGAPAGQAPSSGGSAAPISTASQNAFIQSALPHAQQIAAQTGIDPRLIVAQAALESNFGKSAPGGNLFGIKAAGGQPSTGPIATKEAVNGALTPSLATFAAYGSPEASFAGYGKLMSGDRYAGVRKGATLDDQLSALGKSGYATDPNYAAKVGAIAHGISLPATPQGSTTASADTPTPNAAPPQSDGSVRGDLLAAAAQHGALNPDAPAPGATPTGMAGLPPGVTPAMFAASQNTATDGNALHRNDEIPAGTPPYVPGSTPGPVTASGMPHQMAPGAAARADSGIGAGIGGGPADTKPSPEAVPSGYLDPEGTGANNYAPNDGPSLRDQLVAAMNKGPDLGTVQPAVVPPPTTAGAPPASVAPSVLPPPKPPSGLGSAAPAVVPPPQGDLTAPPEPQDAPSSDGSLRGDLLAAASAHGMDVAGTPVVPSPQGDLTAPPAGPTPDPVDAGLAAGKDVDEPQSDAAMGNTTPDAGPSLRDTIATQFGSGAGTTGPQSDAGAPLAPMGTDQSADPAPPSGPAPTLAGGPSGGPGASPGTPPLPMMAQAGAPGPTPIPPQPGTGAALPSTGPMPPPGAQTLAAAGQSPDTPAPNAAPAGPAPVSPQMLAALSGPQPQPLGLVGNSAAADPNSPQNFARADAMRAQGANGPTPGGFIAGIMGAGTPARGQGAPGSGLMGAGGPWLGGSPQTPSPVPDSTPASAPQSGGPAPAGAPPAGGAPPQGGGQVPAGASQPSAGGGTPGSQGGRPDLFTQGMAVMNNPYASPELKSMVAQRLFPQTSVQKMDDGTLLGFNPQTGQTRVLYQGAKPIDSAPGHVLRNPFTGAQIGDVTPTPDKYSEGADGSVLDKSTGKTTPDPNHFTTTEIDAGNGVKVPVRIGRNPDGSPNVQVMVPGANGAPAQGAAAPAPSQAGPISFNGPAGVAPPASAGAAPGTPPSPAQAGSQSPLGPQVQSLVDHAGAQQIQQAGAKAAAEANAKNDVDEVAASRTKLEGLRQSGQDLAQAQAALNSYKGKMPTGPFGQNALWAQGVANYFGLADPNQLSNMETFAKVATKASAQQIKEFTSKGTNLDLETELKNNPGVSVSDQTNRILIDHGIRTNAVNQQYEQAKQQFYDQNGSLKGFQPQWEQSISGANAIPLSRFPVATKTINGQTFQRYLSTDPSGYSWHPAGEVQ